MQNKFDIDLSTKYGFIANISVQYKDHMYTYTWENPTKEASIHVSLRLNSKIKLGPVELKNWIQTLMGTIEMTKSEMHHTEADLDALIEQKLQQCSDYPNVCKFLKSSGGPERVKERLKEIIFNDGNYSIESGIAIIETELIFESN